VASAIPDLWPGDIGEGDLRTPVAILKEQATLLGTKTDQLVAAEVESRAEADVFFHRFYLVAPALEYKYKLFTVRHPVSLYPMVGYFSDGRQEQIHSEEEFIEWLRGVLTSEETRGIVRALIAQSKA